MSKIKEVEQAFNYVWSHTSPKEKRIFDKNTEIQWYREIASINGKYYICNNCSDAVYKNKLPKLAMANNNVLPH